MILLKLNQLTNIHLRCLRRSRLGHDVRKCGLNGGVKFLALDLNLRIDESGKVVCDDETSFEVNSAHAGVLRSHLFNEPSP